MLIEEFIKLLEDFKKTHGNIKIEFVLDEEKVEFIELQDDYYVSNTPPNFTEKICSVVLIEINNIKTE